MHQLPWPIELLARIVGAVVGIAIYIGPLFAAFKAEDKWGVDRHRGWVLLGTYVGIYVVIWLLAAYILPPDVTGRIPLVGSALER